MLTVVAIALYFSRSALPLAASIDDEQVHSQQRAPKLWLNNLLDVGGGLFLDPNIFLPFLPPMD